MLLLSFLVVAFVLALIGSGIVASRQKAGARWAYRVGVPVAEFWREGEVNDVAIAEGVVRTGVVVTSGEGFALLRQYGNYVSGIAGVVELCDQRLRLRFVTDGPTSLGWLGAASQFLVVTVGFALAPSPARSDAIAVLAFATLGAGFFSYLFWRARRKATALASRLGFSPAVTAQPGAV